MPVQFRTFLRLAVALGGLAASSALAQTSAVAPATTGTSPVKVSREAYLANSGTEFGRIDTNKDGKLSKVEIEQNNVDVWLAQAKARNRANFDKLDQDHNGSLSPAEFARLIGKPPAFNAQQLVTRLDTNHDGQISREEFRTGASGNFDRLDTNKDGALSQAEIAAGRAGPPSPGAR